MSDEGETVRLDDMHFEGPELDIGVPPPSVPYADHEDWVADALLEANGIPLTEEGVLEALRTQENVLLGAAAHAAGRHGYSGAADRLREVARGPDDYAGVEAAFALARLGADEGRELLRAALDRPVGPYLSPLLAAGDAARLGDPSGFVHIREGLGSDLHAVRMLACKQLAFFLPFEGNPLPDGTMVDARAQLERALADPDPGIRAQAQAQRPAG